MPDDPRLVAKWQALQREREQLRARLESVESQLRELEETLTESRAAAAVDDLAAEVNALLGARIVHQTGTSVALRNLGGEANLVTVLLATRVEPDGTWWTDIGRLRQHLDMVRSANGGYGSR